VCPLSHSLLPTRKAGTNSPGDAVCRAVDGHLPPIFDAKTLPGRVVYPTSESPQTGEMISGLSSLGWRGKHAPDFRRDPLVGSALRRDALVASARRDLLGRSGALRLIIQSASAGVTGTPIRTGTTSVPLRFLEAPTCRVRRVTFDYPFCRGGHH